MNDLIYGTRQQGKSTLALALALTRNRRVAIFDPNGQFPVFQSIPMNQVQMNVEQPIGDNQFSIFRVGPFGTDELPERFGEFSEALWGYPELSIIVDESHMLQGGHYVDPNLDRWNRRSPASVSVIQTTHRIVDASPDSRYHAHNVFFFYAHLPRELKTIGENYGPEVAAQVPRLRPHHALHYWKEIGGVPKYSIWDNPRDWYIDLGNNNYAR